MDQSKDNLQKWKIAGAVFLFLAILTSPVWAEGLQYYCTVYRAGETPKCVRVFDDCTSWSYRDAYCCGVGTDCASQEPPAEGEEPVNLGFHLEIPGECTLGGRCIYEVGYSEIWDTTC